MSPGRVKKKMSKKTEVVPKASLLYQTWRLQYIWNYHHTLNYQDNLRSSVYLNWYFKPNSRPNVEL